MAPTVLLEPSAPGSDRDLMIRYRMGLEAILAMDNAGSQTATAMQRVARSTITTGGKPGVIENYREMIGKEVVKGYTPTGAHRPNPSPFKSGNKVNTVLRLTTSPFSGEPAFTFLEDDSTVECKLCRLAEKKD